MYKYLFTLSFLLCIFTESNAQSVNNSTKTKKEKKTEFYFSFGSHRAFYSKSDISFISNGHNPFNFTLEKSRARDDQGIVWSNKAPQYSYSLGFYNKLKNYGIEFQFHHVKYIFRDNQVVHMNGTIGDKHYDQDTLVTPDFVEFEHCDGANYALLNFVKRKNLASSQNQKSMLDLVLKAGAGVVIPKTESTIMGSYYHDKYALSGYMASIAGGLRYSFLKNFFAEATAMGAYANYTHFLIADGHGHQHWFSAQFNLLLGAQFQL
jgi:hypothetical protein